MTHERNDPNPPGDTIPSVLRVVIAGFLIFMSHEFTRLPLTIFGEDSLAVTHALGATPFGMGAFGQSQKRLRTGTYVNLGAFGELQLK
jgi:hypothetical protein